MKNLLIVFALLFSGVAFGQVVVSEIKTDDFTGDKSIVVQKQNKGDYRVGSALPSMSSSFFSWKSSINVVEDDKGPIIYVNFWGSVEDTYGGLYNGKTIWKFTDGETFTNRFANYDADYSSGKYFLGGQVLVDPSSEDASSVDRSGVFADKLRSTDVEAVRMYFGDGYIDFTMDDPALYRKLMAELDKMEM